MPRRAPDVAVPPPRRRPGITAAATLLLAGLTALVVLVLAGKIPPAPPGSGVRGTVFYVVPYHYGFAFYDADLREIEAMEVKVGATVTLHVVPAAALSREAFLGYTERMLTRAIGGLAAGDPQIARKIGEDLELGNVEHIVGITAHPVYLATGVARLLDRHGIRAGAPGTVQEAVRRKDPAIKTVTFTAKKVGAFDVTCVDSGMDGGATCGWGHTWMTARGGLVVTE